MFGREVKQQQVFGYRLSVSFSLRSESGSGGYLNVAQEYSTGPLTIMQLGELLQAVGKLLEEAPSE